MNDTSGAQDEGLVRTIGTRAVSLNIVNMVVGAGIFVLPGLIAAELGSAAIIAYVVCSIAVALVFLCFAEVGSRITRSGGAYAYIEEAVHPKYKTPYVSVIFTASMVCAFALSGTFKPLAVVASGSILIIYLGVSLAVIRLRLRDGRPSGDGFSIPGGPVVPVLSCLFIGWLLLQLTKEEAIGLGLLIGVSVVLYAIRTVVKMTWGT
jgi:amino acid transporter